MPANKKIHLPNPKQARLLKFNGRLKSIVGDIAGGLRRLLLLLLSLIVLMHIAACLLHYIALQPFFGEPGDGEGGTTWLSTVKDWPAYNVSSSLSGNSIDGLPLIPATSRYIASIYFITFTLLSVGYGDVHAITTSERLYIIIIMLLGSAFLAFIISSTTDINTQINQKTIALRQRLAEVQEWTADRNFPSSLRKKIYTYFENASTSNTASEDAIISELSEELRSFPTQYIKTFSRKANSNAHPNTF